MKWGQLCAISVTSMNIYAPILDRQVLSPPSLERLFQKKQAKLELHEQILLQQPWRGWCKRRKRNWAPGFRCHSNTAEPSRDSRRCRG